MRTSPLTHDETIAAAQDLIAAEGLSRFSMRKLAAALDVNPMTIYLRFDSKEALLRAVSEQSLATIDLPAPEGPWEEQLLALTSSLRSKLLEHGNAEIVAQQGADLPAAVLLLTDRLLALLLDAGHDEAGAIEGCRILFWHTVGAALNDPQMRAAAPDRLDHALVGLPEGTAPTFRALRAAFTPFDTDALFEQSTRLLIEGLRPPQRRASRHHR